MQHTMNKECFSADILSKSSWLQNKILSPLSRSPGEEPREYEVHLYLSWPTIVEWVAIFGR